MPSFVTGYREPVADESTIIDVVDRNIDALLRRRDTQQQNQPSEQRVADAVTRFTGSMRFVYIHVVAVGTWIVWNLGWVGMRPFDPSFVILAMVASVEAIWRLCPRGETGPLRILSEMPLLAMLATS